jgi:hypothetical protein
MNFREEHWKRLARALNSYREKSPLAASFDGVTLCFLLAITACATIQGSAEEFNLVARGEKCADFTAHTRQFGRKPEVLSHHLRVGLFFDGLRPGEFEANRSSVLFSVCSGNKRTGEVISNAYFICAQLAHSGNFHLTNRPCMHHRPAFAIDFVAHNVPSTEWLLLRAHFTKELVHAQLE